MQDRNKHDAGAGAADQKRDEKSVHFLISNVMSIALGVLASVIAVLRVLGSERTLDLTRSSTDWIASVLIFNCIYVAVSYGISRSAETGRFLKLIFRIPSWLELRNFGDQRVARVSYIALAAIPLLAYIVVDNPLQLEILSNATLPLNAKLSFFIAFFLSVALITFAVGCPKEFHRVSPFDGAKTVNIVLNSVTETVVKVNEENDNFDAELDASRLEFRAFCWLFYTLGLLLSVVLLIRAALFVVYA